MIRNIHSRWILADPDEVGTLLAGLGGPEDRLWPAPAWMPMRLDRPMRVGAEGGHGPIRYRVTAWDPGRRVRFAFDPACGLDGWHELTVAPADGGTLVEHVLRFRPRGIMRLLRPVVLPVHDAILEDLLDSAERETTGTVRSPARWSLLVHLLQRAETPQPRAVPVPEEAALARSIITRYEEAEDGIDLLDAYALPWHPRLPSDPREWAEAIFHRPPAWVMTLLGVRQLLVGLVGIARDDGSAFTIRERTAQEALLGTDEDHLDFRASVHVSPEAVTLTTVARSNSLRGRLYLLPVRVLHPVVVRAMLARAHRSLVLREHVAARTDDRRTRSRGSVTRGW